MEIGRKLRLEVYGESHAPLIGMRLEGLPSGIAVDIQSLQSFMERRAPGRDKFSTSRREPDIPEFTGGLKNGVTTGEPLEAIIRNTDTRSGDYERSVPRPGHADFPSWVKTGRIPPGGGSNSGRMTAAMCIAGGICLQELARRGISVNARVLSVGDVAAAKAEGDSVGGAVECEVTGLPVGLGGSMFDGIDGAIAHVVFGIPGVKGIEFGNGFASCGLKGSENNDPFTIKDGNVVTLTNNHGGVLGGMTSGMTLVFRVALKPTPSIYKNQKSVDLKTMEPVEFQVRGRHDPCIAMRAVPVVEALTAFAILDAILADEAERPRICLTLTGKTLVEDIAQFKSQRYFADMVELRVDLLKKSERAKVGEFPKMLAKAVHWKVPLILTFRRSIDGGAFEGKEEERLRFFEKLLSTFRTPSARTPRASRASRPKLPSFDFIDLEEGFGGADLLNLAHSSGLKVVRSIHKFDGPVKNIKAKLRALANEGDIAKIAFMPRTPRDVNRLLSTVPCSLSPVPYVVIAMGELGLSTRINAARFGSKWTYASVGGLAKLGHLSPYELVKRMNGHD